MEIQKAFLCLAFVFTVFVFAFDFCKRNIRLFPLLWSSAESPIKQAGRLLRPVRGGERSKTKVFTLTSRKGHRQSQNAIKQTAQTRSKYM